MAAERAAATASARARSTSRSTEGAKNESLGSASGGRPASSTAARYASSTPVEPGSPGRWSDSRYRSSLYTTLPEPATHMPRGTGARLSLELGYDRILGIGRQMTMRPAPMLNVLHASLGVRPAAREI